MSLFPHVAFAAMSDRGRKRKNNEDACYASPSYGVWMVSDGMGGGDDGEVASLATAQAVDKFVKAHPFPPGGTWNVDDLVKGLGMAASDASAWIYARAREKHLKGCGATFVALLLDAANPEEAVALHAGDSRLYRIRGRGIQQITKDHSAAAMLGVKNETEINPMFRGMILRAVGVQPSVELERTALPLKPDDSVLICSDGLSRMVPDKKIVPIVREAETPEEGVRKLIGAANDAGGIDNVTAVLVKFGELPSPVASFPLVLEERPQPTAELTVSDCETAESMTFGAKSSDDPVTGSVTESAMTFDEVVQEEDDAKTRETEAALSVVTSATIPAVVTSAPIPAAEPKSDSPVEVAEGGGQSKPSRGKIVVIVVGAALLAALLAAVLTWFVMRPGTSGGGSGSSAQEAR